MKIHIGALMTLLMCALAIISKAQTYQYDQSGRLIADASEQIASIEWNNQSKIVKLTRTSGSTKPDLEFSYDATGNRLMKVVKPRTANGVEPQYKWKYTYYNNDVSGTVSIDEKTYQSRGDNEYQSEIQNVSNVIFCSERIGMYEESRDFCTQRFTASIGADGKFANVQNRSTLIPSVDNLAEYNKRGLKQFELTDHLGDVTVVVQDRKIYSEVIEAAVVQASDYYAYGMTMRKLKKESGNYRYGFEGIEKDDDVRVEDGSYEFPGRSIYDPRLARFVSVDPQWRAMPNVSPYAFGFNSPIFFTDKSGEMPEPFRIIIGGQQAGAEAKKLAQRFPEERLEMFMAKSRINNEMSSYDKFVLGGFDFILETAQVLDPVSYGEAIQVLSVIINAWEMNTISSEEISEMLYQAGSEAVGQSLEYGKTMLSPSDPYFEYNWGKSAAVTGGAVTKMVKKLKTLNALAIAKKAGCFVGDTEILIAGNKFVYIKDISVEKEVYKLSDEDIKMLEEERAALEYVVEVTLENLEFTVEEDQLFIVNDEWKKAIDLVVGDKLLKLDGTTIEVKSVRKIKKTTILSAAEKTVTEDQKD